MVGAINSNFITYSVRCSTSGIAKNERDKLKSQQAKINKLSPMNSNKEYYNIWHY